MPKDEKNNILAGSITIVMGVGSLIGGYGCGKMVDIKGTLFSGNLSLALTIFSTAFYIISISYPSTIIAFICAFFWGLALFYL